jgi:hypothetical protein
MKTNVYKRFESRVMESDERIGINRGLPTMPCMMFGIQWGFFSKTLDPDKVDVLYTILCVLKHQYETLLCFSSTT